MKLHVTHDHYTYDCFLLPTISIKIWPGLAKRFGSVYVIISFLRWLISFHIDVESQESQKT